MKARELPQQLNSLSKGGLELDVQVVADGTFGSPVYDDIAVQVDTDKFDRGKRVFAIFVD